MKKATRTTKKSTTKAPETTPPFDDEGVRLAILAALECMYECFPHITLPQYLIALEVRKSERDGVPHTLASLVKKLKMPFSTASRVVWSLTEEGGDIGVIRYMCDRVAVMYRGQVVETGAAEQVCDAPNHAYTQALLSAIPRPDPRARSIHRRHRYTAA